MHTYWKRWLPLLLVGSAILAYLWIGVYPTYRLRSLVRPRFYEIPLPARSQQITAEKEHIVTECGTAGIGAYYASDLSWPELATFYQDYIERSSWGESTRSLNPSHGFISSGWPMKLEHEVMLLTIQPIVVRPPDDDILNEAVASGKKVYGVSISYRDRIRRALCEDD
jgi:hypothetical protein